MQTRSLKTLVEIAKVGGFATAAARLNMTVSAVSMQMKALEADLGVALFDRASRPPRLTPLGRTICDEAGRLLSAEASLRAACAPADGLTGRYRIGFIPTASVRLLPTFLLNARQSAPAAAFDVLTGLSDALERDVRAGRLDFAVVTGSDSAGLALDALTVRTEALAFAAPASTTSNEPATLVETLPFLRFMPNSGIGKVIAHHMAHILEVGRGHIVMDSVEAIVECVNRGVGFTLLPEPDIRRYASPATRIFTSGTPGLSRSVTLVFPAAHRARAQRVHSLFSPDR